MFTGSRPDRPRRPVRAWLVADPAGGVSGKQLVVLISGQHGPQEMQSGHTLNAMLLELRRRADLHGRLKDVAFLVVPVVNMDSAFEGGNTALNRNARNLNRVWDTLEEPEIAGVVRCVEDLAGRGAQVALALDFHSGGTCINHPRGIRDEDLEALSPGLARKQALALGLLEKHLGYRRQFHRFCEVEGGWWGEQSACHANQHFVLNHKAPAFTLEVGDLYYFDPATQTNQPVTPEFLAELGPALLEACLGYCGACREPGTMAGGG